MATEEKRNKVDEMEPKGEQEQEPKKDEPKIEEAKKEFILIRGLKATGRGLKRAGIAVNNFVHKHPYVTAGITTGIGYVVKIGVDLLSGSSEEASTESSLPELPEGTDNYVEPEDDSIEIELPEIETTEE